MREKRRPSNYPCQKILHSLKFQDILESNIVIKGIAIIKSTNKSSCNSFGDSKRHILANMMKVTNVIKAAMTSLVNMLSKIIIKGDS